MKESTLLKTALVASVIGIVLLFFVSQTIKLDEKRINQLKADEDVLIRGTVTRVTDREGVSFVEITQENKITLILFNDYPIDLKAGEFVEIIGKTQEYEGNIEVIGKEVRVIE